MRHRVEDEKVDGVERDRSVGEEILVVQGCGRNKEGKVKVNEEVRRLKDR